MNNITNIKKILFWVIKIVRYKVGNQDSNVNYLHEEIWVFEGHIEFKFILEKIILNRGIIKCIKK